MPQVLEQHQVRPPSNAVITSMHVVHCTGVKPCVDEDRPGGADEAGDNRLILQQLQTHAGTRT
jgi:hypothetical protein